MITNEQKERIRESLEAYVKRYPSQNKAVNSLKGTSAGTVSSILNRKWDLISDDMWMKLAAQLDGVTEWRLCHTAAFDALTLYSGNAAAFAGATQAVEQETPLTAAASAGTFLVQSPIDGKSALICTNGANATYNALHLAADCRRLVPWTSGEDGSRWYIEPVDAQQLEVTGGWATANYPFAVELPDGVKAYAATDFGTVGDERPALRLAEVSGAVPACTPVLVEAAEGTYSLPIVADAPAVEGNLLSGTLRSAAVESASLYLLDTADASPVMRLRRTATGNIASNQAYFVAPDSQAEAYVLTTDELVTGIGGMTTEADAPTVYYDLSGRRVKQPARGVYVTADGRKVILK